MNFRNRRQEVERVGESKIFPSWHVFVSIFVQEIKEKVENYSQSGYCSSTITYFKNLFLHNGNKFLKTSDRR